MPLGSKHLRLAQVSQNGNSRAHTGVTHSNDRVHSIHTWTWNFNGPPSRTENWLYGRTGLAMSVEARCEWPLKETEMMGLSGWRYPYWQRSIVPSHPSTSESLLVCAAAPWKCIRFSHTSSNSISFTWKILAASCSEWLIWLPVIDAEEEMRPLSLLRLCFWCRLGRESFIQMDHWH